LLAAFIAAGLLFKFRGAWIRSLATGWGMLALWTAALAARWASALWSWHWGLAWPLSAAAQLVVALLLLWQVTAASPVRPPLELFQKLIFTGLGGLIATLSLQLVLALRISGPVIPAAQDGLLPQSRMPGWDCWPQARSAAWHSAASRKDGKSKGKPSWPDGRPRA